jgi:Cu/Ag efflux pump CusA
VLPLVLAKGAGAEMRNALGNAVFFGMLGVTVFGLIFTPVFYVVIARFIKVRRAEAAELKAAETPPPATEPHHAN